MIHTTQECQIGDAVELLRAMPPESVDTVVTSPPYWGLRDYGVSGQIGLEPTLEEYHERLLEVTAECMRVLKPTGVMFWNHGDSYPSGGGAGCEQSFRRSANVDTGSYPDNPPAAKLRSKRGKCLMMQNERLIMRMVDEQGFVLRNKIIWNKTNGMPSSVTDRFSNKYEPIYMLVKSNAPVYYCNSKTGAMQRDKPPGTKGDEGVDWDSREVMLEDCSTGEVSTETKKVSHWRGHDYWFDLDSVRVPHTTEFSPTRPYTPHGKEPTPSGQPNNLTYNKMHVSGKNPGDVWTIPTQPFSGSHFAVFPPPLIEPMIRAACPAEICPVCGLPRVRITERVDCGYDGPSHQFGGKSHGGLKTNVAGKQSPYHAAKTTGWTSCSCGAGYVAGTVLDPFCGSGTVLEVCRKLNRNAIGIELNPEYAPMIRERSMSHTPPLTAYFGVEPEEGTPCG